MSTLDTPSFSSHLSSIKTLNGTNFEEWNETLHVVLAIMRLDLALEVNKPDAITSQSSAGAKAYFNKWVESNKLCMMIMQLSMDKTIKNSIPQCDNAKDYLAAMSKKFVIFDKAEKSNYMRLLTTTTYDGTIGIREHVMRMTNLAMRLRDMKWHN